MKEIDFLPEWYKSDTRRLSNYHTLSVTVLCLSLLIVVSSFITGRTVTTARAQLNKMQTDCAARSQASKEYAELSSRLTTLTTQTDILEKLDSKIAVSSLLGELSFLIDETIVLRTLRIQADLFAGAKDTSLGSARRIRAAGPSHAQHLLLQGNVRFKIVISGFAADAANVARLVCGLEESPYFCRVVPGVSRNRTVNKYRLSEFEITYHIDNKGLVRQKGQ